MEKIESIDAVQDHGIFETATLSGVTVGDDYPLGGYSMVFSSARAGLVCAIILLGSLIAGCESDPSSVVTPVVDNISNPDSISRGADRNSIAGFEVRERRNESAFPPRFKVAHPRNQTTVTESEVHVTLSIDADQNPVKNLFAYVNGTQVTTRSVSEKSIRIPIETGENVIRIVARNRAGDSEQVVTVHRDENEKVAPRGRGKLIVVAVGVNDYANLPQDLRFASNDARAIAAAMKNQKNVMFDEVETILVTDGDRSPTKENIERALLSFETAGPNDTVILFVAGHAVMQDDEYLFLPHEAQMLDNDRVNKATAIRWQTFQDALAKSAGRRILLVDTCHAGNAFNPELIQQAADQDIVVIASTDGDALAQERERFGHGVFTYALLEGLQGRADLFKDGRVTITELHTWLTNRVESLTDMRQRPVLHVPGGFKNFVFSKL